MGAAAAFFLPPIIRRPGSHARFRSDGRIPSIGRSGTGAAAAFFLPPIVSRPGSHARPFVIVLIPSDYRSGFEEVNSL